MPLIHGYSPVSLHRNVAALVREGRDPAQAAAIAYREARAAWRRKHPRGGYPAHLAGTGRHVRATRNRSADVSILPFAFDVGDHVQQTETKRFGQITRRARNAQGWRQYRIRWHDDGRTSVEEESWLQPFRARMVHPLRDTVHCNARGCRCGLLHTRTA